MGKKQLEVVGVKTKKVVKEPKKVLLIYPIASVASPQMSPPLPILHVGESIKKYGHEVRYFDERWDPEPDMDWPDVVGVSSMTGYQLKGAIRYLKLAKQHGKKTVFGGIHPTAVPEQCIKEDYVDVVVQSEGELAMLDAIEAEPNTIVERQMVTSEDMVSPVSDDTIRYFQKPAETGDTILLTSRGCPFRCGFCLDGDTPVLMRDLTWRPIREIVVGDEVISIEKKPYGHQFSKSKVQATSKRRAQTYEIVTDKGSVITTAEHPWLSHANHSRWRTTENLKEGDRIRYIMPPSEKYEETNEYKVGYLAGAAVGDGYTGHYKYGGKPEQHHFGLVGDDEMLDTFKQYASDLNFDVLEGKFNGGKLYKNVNRIVRTHAKANVQLIEQWMYNEPETKEYKRGFLAGFYDADGTSGTTYIRLCNTDEEVSKRLQRYLEDFGFKSKMEWSKKKHTGLLVHGGTSEKLRFFSVFRPKVPSKMKFYGTGLGNDSATVQEIRQLGEQEVYDIETTDHNFIANGLISHNCYIQNFFSRSWQTVDMDRWKADILRLRDEVGMNKLEHGDDWPGKMPRILEIVEFLWSNGIEYRPSIRAHQIDDEAAKQMADMGIKHISVGMETGSARMLKLTQKDIQKEHQIQCAEALAKHGIWPLYYWITGFPTETVEEVNETLDQAQLLYEIHQKYGGNCTQNFYAYTALPGSPLYDLVDKDELPKTMEAWSDYSLHQTYNKTASNLYHIGGLYFHRGKGDKTDRNFPGMKRLLIAPFELSAKLRWKYRYFDHYWEKKPLEWLLKWASTSQMNELSDLGNNINEDDRVSTILEDDRCT